MSWEDSALSPLLDPPVAAVDLAFEQVGRVAVDQIVSDVWPPVEHVRFIEPRGVVERASCRPGLDFSEGLSGPLTNLGRVVQEALPRRPNLAELAKEMGVSQRSLSRHVEQQTGRTVLQCINPLRAHYYARELGAVGKNKEHLAQEAGFPDSRSLQRFIDRWQDR